MSSKNQEKNDTPVNRPVDKIFAENLRAGEISQQVQFCHDSHAVRKGN